MQNDTTLKKNWLRVKERKSYQSGPSVDHTVNYSNISNEESFFIKRKRLI